MGRLGFLALLAGPRLLTDCYYLAAPYVLQLSRRAHFFFRRRHALFFFFHFIDDRNTITENTNRM